MKIVNFQLRIQAQDSGNPTKFTHEVLTIMVRRNLFAPVFTQRFYQTAIQETLTLTSTVLQETATNRDTIVSIVQVYSKNGIVVLCNFLKKKRITQCT